MPSRPTVLSSRGALVRRLVVPAVIAAGAAVVAVPVGSADAATLTTDGGGSRYLAADGEANQLSITTLGSQVFFTEAGSAPITAPDGCTAAGTQVVTCPTSAIGPTLYIDLGDQDDTLDVAAGVPFTVTVEGGDGNDTLDVESTATSPGEAYGVNYLDGGPGDDTLTDGAGNDILFGGTGADSLSGGAGDDALVPGSADGSPDTVDGGPGTDTFLAGTNKPVSVSLDDQANDGAPGDGDDVMSTVEDLVGGRGADTLVGDGGANRLVGRAGDDTMSGLGGADVLLGSYGADTLAGGRGADTLAGEEGPDTVIGGSGRDDLFGGPGADTLRSRDHRTPDQDSCGAATDTVLRDRADDISSDCERVR